MEITTLGVGIDPSKAVSGAATAVKAAESMATGMNAAGKKAEAAEKGVGEAGTQMGNKVAAGAEKAAAAANSLANNSAWARLKNGLAGMGNTGAFSSLSRGLLDVGNSFGLMNNRLGMALNQFVSMRGMMAGMPGIIAPVIAAVGALALGLGALWMAFKAAGSSIDVAASFEDMENQLAVLIGSFDGAKQRIMELRRLAIETPFELAGLIEANRLLQTFSEGAYASMDAMRVVGDAASAAGQPIKDVAFWVGRLYAGLKGGTAVGEATMRLSEMAIITPKLKNQIEELTKTNEGGRRFAEIWNLAEASMKRFDGAMKLQSRSYNGLKSSLADVRTEIEATFGAPIKDALKPLIASVTVGLQQMVPLAQAAGNAVAGRITGLLAMINSGEFWTAWAKNIWGTFVDLGLTALEKVTAGFAAIGEYMLARATDFIEYLAIATTPAFWSQMGSLLNGIGIDFENALRSAAEGFINLIIDNTPAWLKGDGQQRADFGRIAKPTIPTANLVAPDIANFNNGDSSLASIYARQLAGMKQVTAGTRDYWAKDLAGYNAQKLDPIAKKFQDDFSKNDSMLGKKTGNGGATEEAIAYGKAAQEAGEKAKKAAEDQRTPLQKLMAQWADLKTNVQSAAREIAGSISSNMTDALTDMITGAASAGDAFARMAKSIISDLVRMASQMLINYAIQKAIGFVVGAIGGGGAVAGQAIAGAATTAAVHHTGGVVGEGSNFRMVSTSSFRNAPRFQHGGKVGSGETPAIMEPGETVLTRDNANDIKSRLGASEGKQEPKPQAVTILNVVDRSLIEQHIAANPSIILNAIGANATKVRRALKV